MKKSIAYILVLGALVGCKTSKVIFKDTFNHKNSYQSALTKNATVKEYGENAMAEGHLLTKWNYSWTYDENGDWKQAFYVVPPGKKYMEQAGRSAHFGNYRLMANQAIPKNITEYQITFDLWKNDNDPVFFLLGASINGDGGIRFAFENQLPGTDKTVNTLYTRGALGDHIINNKDFLRKWMKHKIHVNQATKIVSWSVNGEILLEEKVENLPLGGYFGLLQHYERGTRYDNFKIQVLK